MCCQLSKHYFTRIFPFQIGNSCYKISTFSTDWTSARNYCRDVYRSQLVVFETISEVQNLKQHFPAYKTDRFWVGAQKHPNGNFYWEECNNTNRLDFICKFTHVNKGLWVGNEPDNRDGREFWVASGKNAGFIYDASAKRKFVCEYKLQ